MRPLLIFFLMGCALFGMKRALSAGSREPRPLRVHARAGATAHEIEQASERALLAELGLEAGPPTRDPVIRERLISILSEPGQRPEERELLRQAEALELWHEDALIEARLALVGELRLRKSLASSQPSDAELLAYRDAHPERYRSPEQVSFTQLFLAREKHGAALKAHAATLRERLLAEQIAPAAAQAYSEPTNLPARVVEAPLSSVAARFGEEFAKQLAGLAPGAWSEPLPSAFGVHLVWLSQRRPAGLLDLTRVRSRLLADYKEDAARRAVAQQLSALGAEYTFEVAP